MEQAIPLITNIELHVLLGLVLAYLLFRLWFGREMAKAKAVIAWENEKIHQLPEFSKGCEQLKEFSDKWEIDPVDAINELEKHNKQLEKLSDKIGCLRQSLVDEVKIFNLNVEGVSSESEKDASIIVREVRDCANGLFKELNVQVHTFSDKVRGDQFYVNIKNLESLIKFSNEVKNACLDQNLIVMFKSLDESIFQNRREFRGRRAVEFDIFEIYFPLIFGLTSLAVGLFEIF
ncbi:hypothetical protein [Cohaesibacter intestini]|uniref:hypothetical protein n=1 Tax=Cohaesibacter intestini TaxID=2211145 RepID=UPI001300469D|nr:hypothetical protein [Cohaesibacter intestini]